MAGDITAGLQLEHALLSDQIYDLIKGLIKSGGLKPGEQIVESALAKKLKVSQAPVREALKRLGHDGLITHRRHYGNFVTEFSKQEADHARIARVAVESIAARIACGRLDQATIDSLKEIIEAMHAAVSAQDIGQFREHDFAFHRKVVEASGNTYLPRLWDTIEPSLRSMHVLSDPAYDGDWHEVADTHLALIAALDGNDPTYASELFINHAIGHAIKSIHPVGPALDKLIATVDWSDPEE